MELRSLGLAVEVLSEEEEKLALPEQGSEAFDEEASPAGAEVIEETTEAELKPAEETTEAEAELKPAGETTQSEETEDNA
jgi:hypothetical protein